MAGCASEEEATQMIRQQRLIKAHNLVQSALSITKARLVFTTNRGYAGKGPARNIAINDQVCIFEGAISPLIIRPNPRLEGEPLSYSLIGDCYAHGLMHGEGLEAGTVDEIILT